MINDLLITGGIIAVTTVLAKKKASGVGSAASEAVERGAQELYRLAMNDEALFGRIRSRIIIDRERGKRDALIRSNIAYILELRFDPYHYTKDNYPKQNISLSKKARIRAAKWLMDTIRL